MTAPAGKCYNIGKEHFGKVEPMKPSQLAPSMMCVDFAEMTDTLRCFEAQGIEYLHVDIMDGEFVSNFTLGTDFCKYLRSHTSI